MEDRIERDQVLIDKIGKLLAVAAKTTNDAERDAFTNRAMELIAANNLDMAAIEIGGNSAKAAKRADEKHSGGLYQFQRDLWHAVADLNFCMYWNLYVYDREKVSKYYIRKYGAEYACKYHRGGYRFEHRIVGRQVNIAATVAMARYLEATIERLVRDRLPNNPSDWYSEWAHNYREGIADEIRRKIFDRREEQLAEEQKKQRAEAEAAAAARRANASTATAITLASVKQSEAAANYDFLHGEGSYAKLMADRARRAEATRKAEEEYTAWAAANPEEAKKQEEERRKAARRRTSWNAGTSSKGSKYDSGAYWAGREAGEKVSIDPQMSGGARGALASAA